MNSRRRRATKAIRRKGLKNKEEARQCIKSAMIGFRGLCGLATVTELVDTWATTMDVVQPLIDEDDDPYSPGMSLEEDMFHVAGLDHILWDAEDVQCMLYEGDVSGALAEVNRLITEAFE